MTAVAQATTHPALDALAKLGGTADTIAVSLHNLGITGEPGCPGRCVIAQFLATLPGVTGVEVVPTRAWIQVDGDTTTITLPAPVTDLIRCFDDRAYPQLIAPMTNSSVRGGER